MKIMHMKGTAATLIIPLAYLAMAGTAHAQNIASADDKTMSGGSCVPGLQANYTDFDIRAGYIQNKAAGFRWVACSMVTDSEAIWDTSDTGGGTDNGSATANVSVKYGGTGGSTQCTWQVLDSAGNIVETASASVNGVAQTNYSLTSGPMIQGSGTRSFGVNCLIPPGARLHRLNWEEFAYTDPETTY